MKDREILIVYKSRSGFTKRYANWIAYELNCSTMNYKDFTVDQVDSYEHIIYGSRVHAGKLDGLKKMLTHFNQNNMSKLVLFATGGTPSSAETIVDSIWENTFSSLDHKDIPHFYMQSGLNYEEMGPGDRLIMKTLANILGKKDKKSSEEAGCEQAIKKSYDNSSRDEIAKLVEFMKSRVE